METPPNELDWSIPQNHNPNQSETTPMDTSAEKQIPDRKRPRLRDPEGVIIGLSAYRRSIINGCGAGDPLFSRGSSRGLWG